MKTFLPFILFLFPFLSFAQSVKIIGTAPGAEGRKIEVITSSDLLTGLEKTLAQATVDSTGSFTLLLNTDKTISAFLNIDFHRGELFIEPSRLYILTIAPLNYNEIQEINPFEESQSLEITLLGSKPEDLNTLIQSFNTEYNKFVLDNFNYLYSDKDKAPAGYFPGKNDAEISGCKKILFSRLCKIQAWFP